MKQAGRLICVGIGMTLGSHISPRSKACIETADVVFVAASNGLVETWIREMNRDVRSLQPYYGQGRKRREAYRAMVDAILAEVRAGKQVCAAFYGHPGVFALAPHKAIEKARSEGFEAIMEPGISAEDCLYADLGIDPGRYGCQHYEASQFMFYRRRIDPSAFLILWQVGVAGDQSHTRTRTGAAHRELLLELLAEHYQGDHDVILYRAATLPVDRARIQHMPLSEVATAEVDLETTLVIPPSRDLEPNPDMLARLHHLDADESAQFAHSLKNR